MGETPILEFALHSFETWNNVCKDINVNEWKNSAGKKQYNEWKLDQTQGYSGG